MAQGSGIVIRECMCFEAFDLVDKRKGFGFRVMDCGLGIS